MDNFILFLDEYETEDSKEIDIFKEKINKTVEYKSHLDKFEFVEKWFSVLDDILIELGYRALDADIDYIKKELKNKIYGIHIDKIDSKSPIIDMIPSIRYEVLYKCSNIEIIKYLVKNKDNIKWESFSYSKNTEAVKILTQQYPKLIYWKYLSNNVLDIAVHYCIKHPDKIDWKQFSLNTNPIAVEYLIHICPDKIEWANFSYNSADIAVRYCIKHPDKINWTQFSWNSADTAVRYLIHTNPDKIKWKGFSLNANDLAVKYLIERPDKIVWKIFSMNTNDLVVEYLIKHPDKIDWKEFSINSNNTAVKFLIEQHSDKINWEFLSLYNKNINAIRYYNNISTYHHNYRQISNHTYLIVDEFIYNEKITSFNKLNLLPKSGMQL